MRREPNVKDFGDYTAKSIKEWNTDDGGGWACNLYRGKTKIAEVYDGGYGGEPEFSWFVDGEEELLRKFCKKLPKVKCESMDLEIDMGWFVDELVSAVQEKRKWILQI